MASVKLHVHDKVGFDFGPASKFVPPGLEVTQNADNGGGKPVEPNALMFVDPRDGEMHVFLMTDEMRRMMIQRLTGGIVVAGDGDILGGGQ